MQKFRARIRISLALMVLLGLAHAALAEGGSKEPAAANNAGAETLDKACLPAITLAVKPASPAMPSRPAISETP